MLFQTILPLTTVPLNTCEEEPVLKATDYDSITIFEAGVGPAGNGGGGCCLYPPLPHLPRLRQNRGQAVHFVQFFILTGLQGNPRMILLQLQGYLLSHHPVRLQGPG